MTRRDQATCVLAATCLAATLVPAQQPTAAADTAAEYHALGVEHHERRRLDDASREYARALKIDPPRPLTPDELAIVRRFAPRLYTTPSEFFPLKDFAVVLHPERRLVAYHLFWEDDIDFPEDNDPCDHEVLWVQYAADGRDIEAVWTYFHGRTLDGGETALRDARQHGLRPRVNVQWGKHGSLPAGWEQLSIHVDKDDGERKQYPKSERLTLAQYNEETYRTLATAGRRLPDHPIGQRLGWPLRFTGSLTDFVSFTRLVDPLAQFDETGMARVSRWNSATINQYFLPYNFRPKTEWPSVSAASIR